MVLRACLLWALFGHKVACHTQGVLVEGDDLRVEQDLQLLQPQLPAGTPRSAPLQWLSELHCWDTRHTQPCLPLHGLLGPVVGVGRGRARLRSAPMTRGDLTRAHSAKCACCWFRLSSPFPGGPTSSMSASSKSDPSKALCVLQ